MSLVLLLPLWQTIRKGTTADPSIARLPRASWWTLSRPVEQVFSLRLLVRESNPRQPGP